MYVMVTLGSYTQKINSVSDRAFPKRAKVDLKQVITSISVIRHSHVYTNVFCLASCQWWDYGIKY